jgi:Na+/H+ antiporter NhaB
MNGDMMLSVIASIAWLILAGSALASFRLSWSQMLRMALVWIAIFTGVFLIVHWFMLARDTASPLI